MQRTEAKNTGRERKNLQVRMLRQDNYAVPAKANLCRKTGQLCFSQPEARVSKVHAVQVT